VLPLRYTNSRETSPRELSSVGKGNACTWQIALDRKIAKLEVQCIKRE